MVKKMESTSTKKTIPVPVEKALKDFQSFLWSVKEDFACERNALACKSSRAEMAEHFETITSNLRKHINLELPEHADELEIVELVKVASGGVDDSSAKVRQQWLELLMEKVSEILDATQEVNLERLTTLMEMNDNAGVKMKDKDVILLLGSPRCGKTTTLHYLAGTSFHETYKGGVASYTPARVVHPDLNNMKIASSGNHIMTRHLQVAEVDVQGKSVVLCDTPSFGNHETTEEVIANSLGLVRALRKARSVRPVIILSREEIGDGGSFHAYPQIVTILIRLLGSDSNVSLEPFRFVFTKYSEKSATGIEEQLGNFLATETTHQRKTTSNRLLLIQHLIDSSSPVAQVILPNKGDPTMFLKRFMSEPSHVMNPGSFFVPNMPKVVMDQLKRQLKFTLLDMRSALVRDDTGTAIYRMQQMSRLANLLPEAGIYARHGFKAFKKIINHMVENVGDDEEESPDDSSLDDDTLDIIAHESEDSWKSAESFQWSNVSAKLALVSNNLDQLMLSQLSTVSEEKAASETEEIEAKLTDEEFETPTSLRIQAKSPCHEIGTQDEQKKSLNILPEESDQESQLDTGPSKAILELAAKFGAALKSPQKPKVVAEHSPIPPTKPRMHDEVASPAASSLPSVFSQDSPVLPTNSGKHEKGDSSFRTVVSSTALVENTKKSELNAQPQQSRRTNDEFQEQVMVQPILQQTAKKPAEQQTSLDEESKQELPEEELEYTEQYSDMLEEMTIKAIKQEDYALADQKLQELEHLANEASRPEVEEFREAIELFLEFSVAMQEHNYSQCVKHLEQLIVRSEFGSKGFKKCSKLGVQAAIRHITFLREQVVQMTDELHKIEDPVDFDRSLERLLQEREKIEASNIMLPMCMHGSDERDMSETILAFLSHGFQIGSYARP